MMRMKTAEGIRKEIAAAGGYEVNEVKCYNCSKWGYNCGKAINSCGGSKCQLGKGRTYSYQFCKCFEKRVDK